MLLSSQNRAAKCIADATAYARKRWDEKHVEAPVEVGDEVLLSTKHFHFRGKRKLIPPYVGPFGIVAKVGPNAIRVALTPPYDRKHSVFPVSLAKPYHRTNPSLFPGRRKPPPPTPDIIDGEAHWVIDRIVDERRVKPKRGGGKSWQEFLIKWEGRPDEHNRWIKGEDLYNAKEALREYRTARRRQEVQPEAYDAALPSSFSNRGDVAADTPLPVHNTRSRGRR